MRFKALIIPLAILSCSVRATEMPPLEIPQLDEAYVNRFADVVYRIEGGDKARKPYGVLSVKVNSKEHARQITKNSIRNNWKRWHKAGKPDTFIVFFANRWCPPSADYQGNKNWINNARKILNEY
jgi:hypothetical protein